MYLLDDALVMIIIYRYLWVLGRPLWLFGAFTIMIMELGIYTNRVFVWKKPTI